MGIAAFINQLQSSAQRLQRSTTFVPSFVDNNNHESSVMNSPQSMVRFLDMPRPVPVMSDSADSNEYQSVIEQGNEDSKESFVDKSEFIKVKQQRDALQKKVDGLEYLEYKPERIKAMSLEELNQAKVRLQNKMKLIENAERSLVDKTLRCIACLDNKKNIAFMDGCGHIAVCDQCERKMKKKCCPLCNARYS